MFTAETARKAGQKSRRGKDSKTIAIKNMYSDFLDNNGEKIQELFDKVAEEDAAKALDIILKMSAYVIPKPTIAEENKEVNMDKVPAWLRPGYYDEMPEDEYNRKLEVAKRVIAAGEGC